VELFTWKMSWKLFCDNFIALLLPRQFRISLFIWTEHLFYCLDGIFDIVSLANNNVFVVKWGDRSVLILEDINLNMIHEILLKFLIESHSSWIHQEYIVLVLKYFTEVNEGQPLVFDYWHIVLQSFRHSKGNVIKQ